MNETPVALPLLSVITSFTIEFTYKSTLPPLRDGITKHELEEKSPYTEHDLSH